jgi:3-hydroxyisobutyrate dehydrogenase-like beta-hydroxyacid dehydrogenase
MPEMGFAVEMIRGVSVVVAPEEIDMTNATGLRVALLEAAMHGQGTLVVDMTRTQFCDTAGSLDLPYLKMKARAMTERDFTPSFRLRLAAKDAVLVGDSAWQHGLDLPLFELLARRLGAAVAEHGDEDVSATYLTSAPGQAA